MISVALDMVGVGKMASYSDCDGDCDSIVVVLFVEGV